MEASYIKQAQLAAGHCKPAGLSQVGARGLDTEGRLSPGGQVDSEQDPRAIRRMNTLLCLSVLFVWDLSPAHGSLWQLHQMVSEVTGKNALLYYGFYGCYCGLGGKGQPKDATDRCCQLHDTCYENLLRYHCAAKTRPYRYKWHYGRLSCSQRSRCAFLSCECDRSLALCLRRNTRSYKKRFQFYPNTLCR